jgi:hypothetical protein
MFIYRLLRGGVLPGALSVTLASVTVQPLCAQAVGDAHRLPRCMEISNIRDFGARESASASVNFTAIKKAIASKRPVYIPYGTFNFNQTVHNPDLTPMFGPGTLNFTGTFSGPDQHAIVLGEADGEAHMAPTSQMTVLHVTCSSPDPDDPDWTVDFEQANAGVALINVYDLTARLWVERFETGVLLEGNERGCAYNTLHLGRLKQNRVGVRLHGHGDGYVNQNTFIGGRFGGLGLSSYDIHGVEFHAENEQYPINGNVFLNPSFEWTDHTNYLRSCFHGRGAGTHLATKNLVVGMRMEGQHMVLLSGRGIENNEFRFTYGNAPATNMAPLIRGDDPAADLELAYNRFLGPPNLPLFKDEPREVARWGRAQLVQVDPTGSNSDFEIAAPARGAWWNPGAGHFDKQVGGHALLSDQVEVVSPSFPGVLFDLRNVGAAHRRRIAVKCHLAGQGGRVAVVAFDHSLQPIVNDATATSLNWWSGGGYYRLGGEMDIAKAEYEVVFGNQVAYAFVGVARGTLSAKLQEISYFTLGEADVRPVLRDGPLELAGTGASEPIPMLDITDPIALDRPATPSLDNTYSRGTFVRNGNPVEEGALLERYLVKGWTWDGTTWLDHRAPTGN